MIASILIYFFTFSIGLFVGFAFAAMLAAAKD
jgi:hypothetical protein